MPEITDDEKLEKAREETVFKCDWCLNDKANWKGDLKKKRYLKKKSLKNQFRKS